MTVMTSVNDSDDFAVGRLDQINAIVGIDVTVFRVRGTGLEKHLTGVLQMKEGLCRSPVLGEPVEGFKTNFQRRYGLRLQTSCLSSQLHGDRRFFLYQLSS